MLGRFWLLKGVEGQSESANKGKFVTKIFFQIRLNEVLKKLQNITSADVKADVKDHEIKEMLAVSKFL